MPFIATALKIIQMMDTASNVFNDIFGEEPEPVVEPPPYQLHPRPLAHPEVSEADQYRERYQRLLRDAKQREAEWKQREESWKRQRTDDVYAVLGVTETAPDYVVKAAYKAAAQRVHSDHGGTDGAMARLNRAMDEIARRRGWKQ